jgi:hypothetical protein
MLSSITSTGVAWCDGGVSPVVDGVGPNMMRSLVNYPANCCAWRGVNLCLTLGLHKLCV